MGGNSMFLDSLTMLLCRVAFVVFKIIAGKLLVERCHHLVTSDLGNNRGGSNGCGTGFALNQWLLRSWQWNRKLTVHEKKIRGMVLLCQVIDGMLHGKQRGLEDIDLIYGLMGDNTDSDTGWYLLKMGAEEFSFFGREFFRVEKEGVLTLFGKNDCGGNHWSGQRSSANLIETCNNRVALLLQVSLEMKVALLRRGKQG